MRLVLDASVIVKWLVNDADREPHTVAARALFAAVAAGEAEVVQPPHWLAEVAAVMTRLSPDTVAADLRDLHTLDFEIAASLGVYQRAVRLAVDLGQHVFDTLYHAVAIESADRVLVTADLRYLNKARAHGRITALERWQDARGASRP